MTMIGITDGTKPQHCGACPFFAYRRVPSTVAKSPILLLGEYPSITSPQGGKPFQDREGSVVNMALRHLQKSYYESDNGVNRWKNLTPARAYAVQCIADDKPPKLVVSRCRAFLLATLDQVEPRLIITFGASTLQHLTKHKYSFDSVRGTFLPFKRLDEQRVQDYTLFATYTPKAVLAKPGLFDELLRDLRKAFLFAEQRGDFERLTEEQLRANYIFPHTVDAVQDVCQLIIDYHHDGQPSEKHLIAFDTETSTLEMHDKDAKIIAVSFSWDTGKSTTIVLDHPDAWWTPSELAIIKQHVQRVFACKKPKVAHNAKFDWKGIFHRYGWHIENLVWDTMCGEHLLEEDKRGEYGLKSLTRTRLPRYAGYEDRIAEIRDQHGGLTRAQSAKKFRKDSAKYEIAMHDYATKADIFDTAFAEYKKGMEAWTDKRNEEKKTAKAEKRVMDKGVIGRKPRKPPKPRPPKKPERQSIFDYTMIPLPELELYAAVDPDVTRQHVLHQNERFNAEYNADIEARERYNRLHKKVKWDIPPRTKRLMGQHVTPLTRTLSAMEFTGFPVDLPYLEDLDQKLQIVVENTEKRLYELAGRFVANNPRDVVNVLFQTGFYDEKAGTKVTVPVDENTRRTAKLQIKADEKALLYVANTYGYEFPKQLIQYRKAQKARSPFLINVRENAVFDGRMHPQFHIAGTGTGRTSSSDENMQNCFSGDTEILTQRGWLPFTVLPQGLAVAQFDPVTGQVTFTVPTEYVQRPAVPGEMRYVTLEQIDLFVTGAHEQLIQRQTGAYAKIPVDKLNGGSNFVHAGEYPGGSMHIDPAWVILLCAAQADGSWNGSGWDFSFSRTRKIHRFETALKQLKVDYHVYTNVRRTRFYIRQGVHATQLREQLSTAKQFGAWLLSWDRASLNLFLDEVMHWDGSFTRRNCYSSNNAINADWVQIIAVMSNRRARIRPYYPVTGNTNWQVDIPYRKHSWTNNIQRYTVDYSDDVYCVRVPTGCIIVRRNGKAVITGNCPKKLAGFNIKKIFIPPPGMVLMNTDAKGAEVRIFATYSKDQHLIDAILGGMDAHSFFTSKVYPEYHYDDVEKARKVVDVWTAASKNKSEPFYLDEIITRAMFDVAEVLVKKRTSCKRTVFGILYGAMAKKISETAGIPLEEAQKIIDLMFEMFPSIPAYIKSTEQEIMLFRGVYTKTGRKRRFPMVEMNAFRNRCFRQGVNFKIQSTSSDIVLWVLNQIFPVITHDIHGEFHATVHDSIVFSVPPQYVAQIKPLMYEYGTRRAQEAFPWLVVPFLWDVEAGPSYGETSDVEEYLKGQKQHDAEAEDLFTDEEFKEELNEQLATS